ncbi:MULTISPECIES: AAA family ATPase [Paenibacillus]|uniref:AAA family ATPase n=1 Tax=Paenibacillus TaxID=44249 RepID=UPI00034E622F|nr:MULTISPECIES: AAA family ATPase [Paenibacillus]EPD81020.1 stage V sporulation protein K [Paenibacillus sp. HGH0039]MBV6714909.1 AAA family ATPase [Paenibacillus chitinolyticus]
MDATSRRITVRSNSQINIVFNSQEAAPLIQEPESTTLDIQSETFNETLKELNTMIGLQEVKDLIYQMYATLHINKLRSAAGLKDNSQVYHMIFKGNPGTGKTTVARILAKLFKSLGVLSKGHLIEVERADLVGEYIGHTAIKTRDLIKKALGGILFIDEAYSLARGGEKDFGKEAIDCLVKSLEDHKNDFILILAGYPDEIDYFLSTNPGLPSRFPIQVDFTDYNVDQLIQIAELMINERDYTMRLESVNKLRDIIIMEKETSLNFNNARFVRNVIEKSIRNQAVRLLSRYKKPSKQDLMEILPQDVTASENKLKMEYGVS